MRRSFHVGSFDKSLLLIIVAFIAVIIQVMDKSFGDTLTLSLGNVFPRTDILVFGLMILISITIQSVLIKKAREAVKIERSKSTIGQTVLMIAALLQYSAAGILVIVLFQALFTLKYSVVLLEAILGINLITSSVILAILSSRFVRTFRLSHTKLVFAYMIAIATLSLSGIVTFIYVENFLQRKPDSISSGYNPWASFSPVVPTDLVTVYQLIGIISFATLWIATVFLTNHYTSKSKKIKYWIIVSIPLVYFASQFLPSLLQHLDPLRQLGVEDNPMYGYVYNLFLNTVRTAGGIMFGFVFFILSKTIQHSQLKNSLIMTGIGLILIFGANASSLIIMTPYPPWGILSATFLITGAYSLIIGLDSAALYVATDSSLRRVIEKSPQKDYDILKSLGNVKMQDIVINKIENISTRVYEEIQSDNLLKISSEPTNIREYIDQVLRERWNIDRGLLQKSKDRTSAEDLR
jgi:hypothetical protein